MQKRPLLMLAALAAVAEPDLGRAKIEEWKRTVRNGYKDDPIEWTVKTVLVASWLFYRAERGKNPKVNSFPAAVEYVTSSLSVGYTDIYPKTALGKTIASALMTIGPAMAANILEEPSSEKAPPPDARDVVDRLDRILAALERSPRAD